MLRWPKYNIAEAEKLFLEEKLRRKFLTATSCSSSLLRAPVVRSRYNLLLHVETRKKKRTRNRGNGKVFHAYRILDVVPLETTNERIICGAVEKQNEFFTVENHKLFQVDLFAFALSSQRKVRCDLNLLFFLFISRAEKSFHKHFRLFRVERIIKPAKLTKIGGFFSNWIWILPFIFSVDYCSLDLSLFLLFICFFFFYLLIFLSLFISISLHLNNLQFLLNMHTHAPFVLLSQQTSHSFASQNDEKNHWKFNEIAFVWSRDKFSIAQKKNQINCTVSCVRWIAPEGWLGLKKDLLGTC